jgi:hypothetical protein
VFHLTVVEEMTITFHFPEIFCPHLKGPRGKNVTFLLYHFIIRE